MFLLTRHAKSEHNVSHVFAGSRLETKLVAEGREQAEKLGKRIALNYQVEIIMCSQLLRSYETALIFKKIFEDKYRKNVTIIRTELLNEVDVGVITGMKPRDALSKHPREYYNIQSQEIKDWNFARGESFEDLQERYRKLAKFLLTFRDKKVLLVGHEMFNRVILENHTGTSSASFDHNLLVELASLGGEK